MISAKKQTKKWSRTETIIVLFVLFLIAFLVLDSSPGFFGRGNIKFARRAKASNYAAQIFAACENYKIEYGTLPPSSENYRLKGYLSGDSPRKIEFISLKSNDLSPKGEMIDPWKTPFRIEFDPDSKVHVVSAGPDKIFGTPDDISN